MKRHRRATHTSIIMITLAATLAASTGGCSSDSDSGLPPPASPGPQTTDGRPALDLTPAEQQAVDEAQARFDAFMNDYISVSTADLPTAETAEDLFFEVDRHAAGLLSQELRAEIIGRWGQMQVGVGTLRWTLHSLQEVDLDFEVNGESYPSVHLVYCIDASGFETVDSVARGHIEKARMSGLWTYTIRWSDDWFGQGITGWRVAERSERGDQC